MVFGTLDIEGQEASEKYSLSLPSTGLGRDPQNEVCLDHPKVSRFHARIVSSAEGCQLLDLGSANGTRVDGEELEAKVAHDLHDGSCFTIGPFSIKYRNPESSDPLLGADEGNSAVQPGAPRSVVVSGRTAPRLLVTTPRGTEEYKLRGTRLTLGRDPSNDVVVAFDAVSRRHAVLERRDSSWEIADLGSSNGLWTATGPVTRMSLSDGDALTIGQSVRLEFHQADEPGVQHTATVMEFEVPQNAPLTLGRSDNADVSLSHPQVSRAHARVTRQGAELIVEDLGSSSGTYVNGQLVKRRALGEGDIVRIGTSRLVLAQGKMHMFNEEGNLRIDALHLSRQVGKGLRILQDVCLSILPQEFVAIVGGSGSGKTTLLNALCGFHPATGGNVLLNGVSLYQSFGAYRNDLGYVPQDDIIHRELPVFRALNYAAELRMPRDTTALERQKRVQQVLEQLDIQSCRDRAVRQLSGGQRKRVSMGVELLTRPSLFFLDEATSGLDPGTESQMMRLLRRLADEGRTVVLVTHATKNVMTCDKVAFLARGGHLAYFGGPEEALRYFNVDDFDEIYTRLDEGEPLEWGRRFRSSGAYRENVELRLASIPRVAPGSPAGLPPVPLQPQASVSGGQLPAAAAPASIPGVAVGAVAQPVLVPPARPTISAPRTARFHQVSGFRQFLILCRRYLDTIWGDKKTAALLLAIAPFLGMLDFLIWKRNIFDPQTGSATQAVTMFFITCLITVLVGTITSVREIVKEDAVYRRERMVGLGVLPFVASKAAVGFAFAIYSSVMLFVFLLAAVDFSHLGGLQALALLVPMILGTFAGVMWGLLVSAVAPSEDRAMLLVILVLVPQFVFSGGIIPMADIGLAGKVLGWITSARWELGALVTSAKVEGGAGMGAGLPNISLPGMEGLPTMGEKQGLVSSLQDQYGDIFHVNVGFYWLMAVVLTSAVFLLVLYLQKRKDTL
ncbi:MAG: FHA domain-containing protein [Actinobacteria bacterium]|nr:FHA domain-containing protein [Actinomycetota bacterium]